MISDPLFLAASTTTTASESPLMIRFRAGKWNGRGAVPGGHSLSTTPSAAIGLAQPAVLGRIDDVHTRSEDGGRRAAGRKGAAMGGGIDAARQSADHERAGRREVPGQPRRCLEAVGRRGA